MLPDFVSIKKELAKRVLRQIHSGVYANAPLLREIKTHRMHEGNRFSYETADGQIVNEQFKGYHHKFELPANLSPEETRVGIENKISEMTQAMGSTMEKALFKMIEDVTDQTGNVVHGGGKPFHLSMFWDAMEKMAIDFDERGQPRMPTWVVHPEMMAAIEKRADEWNGDVTLAKRRAEVLEKKREEWRDREATRKLAR